MNLKSNAVVVDLDGTLSDYSGVRNPFQFEKCDLDAKVEPVARLVNFYHAEGYKVIICSGRDDSCKELTESWLKKHQVNYDFIFMRKTGDRRRDSIIKKEIYHEHIEPEFDVYCVLDDRFQVIKECWHELGLYVFCCNQGLREF